MENSKSIKETVKNKYSEIVTASKGSGCCGPVSDCCGEGSAGEFTMIGDDYKSIDGYVAEADLGLGCGLPTEFAGIKKGDIVVDLGSGAGNDVFIARNLVGETGLINIEIKKSRRIELPDELLEKYLSNQAIEDYKNSVKGIYSITVVATKPESNRSINYSFLRPSLVFGIGIYSTEGLVCAA